MRHYKIAFDYRLENAGVVVPVTATVEIYRSGIYYVVKDISVGASQQKSVLSDIAIRKIDGKWVHRDSGKATPLSLAAGKAIDEEHRKQ
jgi:hypothetical protein